MSVHSSDTLSAASALERNHPGNRNISVLPSHMYVGRPGVEGLLNLCRVHPGPRIIFGSRVTRIESPHLLLFC